MLQNGEKCKSVKKRGKMWRNVKNVDNCEKTAKILKKYKKIA